MLNVSCLVMTLGKNWLYFSVLARSSIQSTYSTFLCLVGAIRA